MGAPSELESTPWNQGPSSGRTRYAIGKVACAACKQLVASIRSDNYRRRSFVKLSQLARVAARTLLLSLVSALPALADTVVPFWQQSTDGTNTWSPATVCSDDGSYICSPFVEEGWTVNYRASFQLPGMPLQSSLGWSVSGFLTLDLNGSSLLLDVNETHTSGSVALPVGLLQSENTILATLTTTLWNAPTRFSVSINAENFIGQPIPEPASAGLVLVGLALVTSACLWRGRKPLLRGA